MSISTTIKHRPARGYLIAATTILAAWFGGIAALAVVIEPTPSVVVVGPLPTVLRAAAAINATIIEVHTGFSRLRSEHRGFVWDLYRNGAWFVWPAIEGGCLFQ